MQCARGHVQAAACMAASACAAASGQPQPARRKHLWYPLRLAKCRPFNNYKRALRCVQRLQPVASQFSRCGAALGAVERSLKAWDIGRATTRPRDRATTRPVREQSHGSRIITQVTRASIQRQNLDSGQNPGIRTGPKLTWPLDHANPGT